MGRILPTGQQEEIYPPETFCPDDSLVYLDMAKSLPNQQLKKIASVRTSIETLMAERGMSYRDITKAARSSQSVGRNINNFILGNNYPTLDSLIATAEALQLELWQLCVPGVSSLDRIERQQVKDLVDAFVKGGSAAREFLSSALRLTKPAPGTQDIDRI